MNHLILREILGLKRFWLVFQYLIVAYFSFVSVQSNYIVEATPAEYEDQEPLVIYASSSNWKWHFSYPEEDIETVNYLYIPADRPIEFKFIHLGQSQVSGFHNLADKNMRWQTWLQHYI